MRTIATALKHRLRERRRYYIRLEGGRCGRCGKAKVAPGIMVCVVCRAKDEARRQVNGRASDNARRRRLRRIRARLGYCTNCGEPSSPGYKLCDRCRAYNRVYRVYYQQVTKGEHD